MVAGDDSAVAGVAGGRLVPDAVVPERPESGDPVVRALAFAGRALERAAARSELTLAQYRVLALVATGDERATAVARRLDLAKPTITAVVDGLVARGLMTRTTVEGDRRASRLVLTAAGVEALVRSEADMGEVVARVLAHADDPDAVVAALTDLDRAMTARMAARFAEEER